MKNNPAAGSDISNTDIALIVGGVGLMGLVGYLIWNASQQAAQLASGADATAPGTGAATSPTISVAATEGPVAPVQTMIPTIGLGPGYYWESQGTTQSPTFGSPVEAIAMSPDDVASAVYGNVISGAGSNVTFLVTSYGDPNSGLSLAQEITLPISYVVPT